MKTLMMKHVAGLTAAACTTLVLFSAVASLADRERTAVVASKSAPATLASNAAATVR